MSAAEAGLHIPEGVPTSAHPTEDEDSTSQSSPKEEEEEKLQITAKKSPKKVATVARKPVTPKHPTASAAFEDYSSIPSGKTEGRRPGRPRKSPNTKKPGEDKGATSPSTSGEARQRTVKKIRQKGSPRKLAQKGTEEEEKSEMEGEVQVLPGQQKPRPAQKKRSNSNAGKVKQNKLRASPARKVQLEEEVQEAEVCIEELPPSSSPARISPTIPPTSILGTTRKKRRVEAIVETLQKSSNSPSSSGNSPRDVKEEIEEDDDVKMEIKEELEDEDKLEEDEKLEEEDKLEDEDEEEEEKLEDEEEILEEEEKFEEEEKEEPREEGRGASAVPTLARLSPLFISKPRRKPADPSSRSLRQSPARSIKASRSDEEASDEYS